MLIEAGLRVDRQKPIGIEYGGLVLPDAFRADLIVENSLIIEIKSVEQFAPVHGKQLLTYLRLTKQPLGLLFNFGAPVFRDGVKRVVQRPHQLRVFASSRASKAGGELTTPLRFCASARNISSSRPPRLRVRHRPESRVVGFL